MFNSFKRQWKSLRQGRPGHRFQERYETSKRSKNRSVVSRIVYLVIALISFAVGVVLVFIPGPAILFFAISGGLIAGESRWMARALDWTELKIRAVLHWGLKQWRRLHGAGKTAVVSLATVTTAALAYASYCVLAR